MTHSNTKNPADAGFFESRLKIYTGAMVRQAHHDKRNLYWCQIAFHREDFRHHNAQGLRNAQGQQNRRIRASLLNAHDRLTTDTHAQSQFFLRHVLLEAQSADGVLQLDGGHRDGV